MDENILKFRVGIFVVIAMCILGILIFLNSEGWVPQYTLYMKPTAAPGVTQGTPIRKNGILIGRVKSVRSQDDHVLLEFAINQDERIYENEICSIGSESLLGDAMIEVLTKPVSERGSPVTNEHVMATYIIRKDPSALIGSLGTEIQSIVPKMAETLEVIKIAASSVDETGQEIRELTGSVQGMFEDEGSEVKALLKDLRQMSQNASLALEKGQVTLDNFNRVFENVNSVMEDPNLKGQIKNALAEIPKIFQEVRVTVSDTRDAIRAFGNVPKSINENLENIKPFTAALKTRGPEILEQVDSSLANVDKFVTEIRQFTSSLKNLQSSKGTIGKLLNDPEIYDRALETVKKVQEISSKIEPLMNDLRMFGDEIARDPGVLGVRGALDRRPSKSGYKGNAVGRENGGSGMFNFKR